MTEPKSPALRWAAWALLLLSMGAALLGVAGPTGADGRPLVDELAALGCLGVASVAAAFLTQLPRM